MKTFIKIIIVLLFYVNQSLSLFAQNTYSISGTVKAAKEKTPLIGVSVKIRLIGNPKTVSGTTTNNGGYFVITKLPTKNYQIEISYIGYLTDTLNAAISNANINLNTIFLQESNSILNEVTISSNQTRVEIKGDTIQFNADAFKTRPDATAEDLIKKMPGVTTDGTTVKVNGEEVKKVMIDGKPFFGDDPSATLKNFPAYMVDNVQVYDKSSDQAQFTGFRDDNDEKTINLNTKKGKNVGQFGNISGSYGSDNKYNSGITFNSFNGNQRISILGMSNNINQQNFSISDIMSVMSNSNSQGGGPPEPGSAASNFFSGQQSGITKTNACGINYSDNWGKKITVSGNYFFNQTNNTNNSSIIRNYFTQNNLQYNQTGNSQTENINHKFYLKLEYKIDSLNKVLITPKITIQNNSSNSSLNAINSLPKSNEPISRTNNNSISNNDGYSFSNDILFQHKFHKKGRTISLKLNTQINNREGNGNYYSSSLYQDTLANSTILNQKYNSSSKSNVLGGNLSYTEPIGKKGQLMFSYRPTITKNEADKTTYNANTNGEYTDKNIDLSNKFNSTYQSQCGGLNYRHNSTKANLSLGVDIEQAKLMGNQFYPDTMHLSKEFNNLLPSASFNYKFSKTLNLNVIYRTNTKSPNISQLQNSMDVSNPLFVKSGNPYLKQTFENNVTIRMGRRSPEKEQHFFISIMANETNNYISNATYLINTDTIIQNIALNKGSQLIVPINLNNYYSIRSFGVYGFPLKFMKSNFDINAGYTLTHSPALIDSLLNYSSNNALSTGFYLSSNVSPSLDFTLSYNGSINLVKNTVHTQSTTRYYNHTASIKINYILYKKIVLTTDLKQSTYYGLSQNYNLNYILWNASVGYKFFKDQSLEAKLSATDMLNQNKSISRTVTESYTQDSNTHTLGRFFMISLTYTFKHFKDGATGPEEINFPKNMPPPPNNMTPPGDIH